MDQPFNFTISKAQVKGETSTYDRVAREEVEELVSLLKSIGCDIRMTWPKNRASALVEVSYMPTLARIDIRMNRGGGRPKDHFIVRNPTEKFTRDITVREFLEWYKTHTAKEAQDVLEMPPATFFRRLKDLRELEKTAPETKLHWLRISQY